MKTIEMHCDKCKKKLDPVESISVQLGESYSFDFCLKCFGSLLRSVGNWMEKKDETIYTEE